MHSKILNLPYRLKQKWFRNGYVLTTLIATFAVMQKNKSIHMCFNFFVCIRSYTYIFFLIINEKWNNFEMTIARSEYDSYFWYVRLLSYIYEYFLSENNDAYFVLKSLNKSSASRSRINELRMVYLVIQKKSKIVSMLFFVST